MKRFSRFTTRAALARMTFAAAIAGGVFSLVAWRPQQTATQIRFAHVPAIANDGRIAFSYHDDIWIADADGSHAHRLTVHIGNDFTPRFSPDGKWVAFTSNRTGNNDVFVVSADGGEPRQLTWHTGNDEALYWTPDGKALIMASNRGPGAFGSPLYRLPLEGEPAEPLGMASARLGMLKQDASLVAYNRTTSSTGVWRKAFKGNSAAGISILDMKSGEITELTNADPHDYKTHVNDLYPMWGADGLIYFTSERDGTYNIWRMPARSGPAQQVTHFKTGGVFYPSISPDGKKVVFQNEFDLWTLDVPNGSPKKLSIPVAFDPKDGDIEIMNSTNSAEGFGPSPNGDHVAVDYHGDIRIVPSEQNVGEPSVVAATAWRENNETFSPDGKTLAYISDESGDQEVWLYDTETHAKRRVTTQPSEKGRIVWAPNSRKLAYTGDNKLWEIDLSAPAAQQQPRELGNNVAGGFNIAEYAADGTWLVYSRRDDENNADIYLYDIAAKKEYNVTQSPATETVGALTPDGKSVVFTSNRDGALSHLFVVSLAKLAEDPNDPLVRERIQRAAAARSGRGAGGGGGGGGGAGGAPVASVPPSGIELDGIEDRAQQLTTGTNGVGGFFIGTDGRTIYFTVGGGGGGRGGRGPAPATPAPARGRAGAAPAADDQGTGLFAIGVDGRDRRRIAAGTFPGMIPTADKRAIFFRAAVAGGAAAPGGRGGGGGAAGQEIHRLALATPQRDDRVAFAFPVRIDRREEWKQMFEEMWRVMKYRYYNPAMNGYDWAALKAKYEPMLEYAGTNEDVYDLGNALIGEMSSSHTGMSGPATRTMAREYNTRFLGFEMEASQGKYRINHIYRTGPADKDWLGLKIGDYVLAIDGRDIKAGDNYWKILAEALNDYVPVKVAKTPTGEGARTVRIATVTNLGNIKYEEFVLNNRDVVTKATTGQIAYVHIRAMDQPSLERFQNEIDRYWQKRGIIIDVRFNTGGNIDEELLDIIERRPYMFTNNRTGARTWGRRPRQAIAGPKVMLINQRSFSDGEATPMGFHTLGLGRIVGTPTAGGVIWTGSYSLINGGTVRTPGSYAVVYDPTKPNNYGINLENFGVPPDVWVQNTLMDEVKGFDRELQGAIDEVMRMLKASPGQYPGVGPTAAGPTKGQ
jgi:tricorn protease